MEELKKYFEKISWGGNIIASIFLTGITLLMAAEIIGRSAFNSPIPGTFEIVGGSMAVLTTIGFAFALRKGMHIRATFLMERWSPKAQQGMLILAYAVGLLVTGILFSQLLMSAIHSVAIREYTYGLVHIPIYVPRAVFAFAVLLFCLGYLFQLVDAVRKLRQHE